MVQASENASFLLFCVLTNSSDSFTNFKTQIYEFFNEFMSKWLSSRWLKRVKTPPFFSFGGSYDDEVSECNKTAAHSAAAIAAAAPPLAHIPIWRKFLLCLWLKLCASLCVLRYQLGFKASIIYNSVFWDCLDIWHLNVAMKRLKSLNNK